jgi:hypothetical protein
VGRARLIDNTILTPPGVSRDVQAPAVSLR